MFRSFDHLFKFLGLFMLRRMVLLLTCRDQNTAIAFLESKTVKSVNIIYQSHLIIVRIRENNKL